MELRWVLALREHGTAYTQCKDDLSALRREYHEELARANPEKPYTVAKLQGKIEAVEDLLHAVQTEERKEQLDADRRTLNQRNSPGKLKRASGG